MKDECWLFYHKLKQTDRGFVRAEWRKLCENTATAAELGELECSSRYIENVLVGDHGLEPWTR
ncbi:hypothetical protein EMEDMD4_230014 [Sinorhizobium medicae]|uniref:Uncharacterized protein n=1 Tax=Sinorhizobium medicae TaxID=110321 RepID=A0A508WZA2_9HYPH|nr:hypothetical protein EMEDMD4_230014 [Sinorhizobium medicae]